MPVGVDGQLFILLADLMPLAGLLLFWNVSTDSSFFHRYQRRAAVIPLVANKLLDTGQIDCGYGFRRFSPHQVRHMLTRLCQGLDNGCRVAQIGWL